MVKKNTKYFCNLEKVRKRKHVMTRLLSESGNILTNPTEIMSEQVSFYKKLYDQNTVAENVKQATNEFLADIKLPRLDDADSKSCEGYVSINETSHALAEMENGSAPGMDGITIEFMKFFWPKLKETVTASFNKSFEKGELSSPQYQGVIILIHKGKELNREHLTNWRPITLTNTDYKILA